MRVPHPSSELRPTTASRATAIVTGSAVLATRDEVIDENGSSADCTELDITTKSAPGCCYIGYFQTIDEDGTKGAAEA